MSFTQRIREVELRFSGDQDSVEQAFQKLEQHYQCELQTLSQSHTEQKLLLDTQMQEALKKAEEERRTMEGTMKRDQEQLIQRWGEEMHRQESQHEKNMEEVVMENQHLKKELEKLSSVALTAELELSRQLNELHNRLQESLETRDELQAQSERRAAETELLLQQAVEEREQLLRSHAELQAKSAEMLSSSERHSQERIELLRECHGWRVKSEELEVLLQQAAADFYLERTELQEQVSMLEERLRDGPEDGRKGLAVSQGSSAPGKAVGEESAAGVFAEAPGKVSLERDVDMLTEAGESDLPVGSEQGADGASAPDGCPAESPCSPGGTKFNVASSSEAFLSWSLCEEVPTLQVLQGSDADGGIEDGGALKSRKAESKPQDVPVRLAVNESPDEDGNHEIVGDPLVPKEVDDPDMPSPPDLQVPRVELGGEPAAHLTAETHEEGSRGDQEASDEGADCPLLRLQVMWNTATEENILLLEKISLLQHKTDLLENLLDRNGEKIKAGNRLLEENYSLKVQILLLLERVKELELKSSEAADLQGRYEDCVRENARLKHSNGELERRVRWLERGVVGGQGVPKPSTGSLLEDISTLREDNKKFSELLGELRRQREILSAIPAVETLLDLPPQAQVQGGVATQLQDCCAELEKQNTGLRQAIWALQDESQTLHETTLAQR